MSEGLIIRRSLYKISFLVPPSMYILADSFTDALNIFEALDESVSSTIPEHLRETYHKTGIRDIKLMEKDVWLRIQRGELKC